MHNITNGLVIYHILAQTEDIKQNHVDVYSYELGTHFFAVLVIIVFFNTLALLFLTQLIVFHIELKYKGLTTYEFLKLKENVTRESKIVIKVNQNNLKQELTDEMEGRRRILEDQAKIRRQLELLEQKEAVQSNEDNDQLQK